MNTRQTRHKENGSSLAEAMVALGLVMMGLVGIVVLYTRSFALNRDVVNRTIAAGLAAEGVEIVKNVIDIHIAERAGFAAFLDEGDYGPDYTSVTNDAVALPPPSAPLHMIGSDASWWAYIRQIPRVSTPTGFSRTVSISFLSPDEISVTSTVAWADHGGTKSVNIEDHFYNWRP
ncbi:MAG: hypothetical protein V1885_00790 [Candidatus Brennerbacteria bacterium]